MELSQQCLNSFQKMALEQVNFYRKQHGANLLVEDTYLKNFAQKYSKKLNDLGLIVEDSRLTKLSIGNTHFQANSTDPFDLEPFDCECILIFNFILFFYINGC